MININQLDIAKWLLKKKTLKIIKAVFEVFGDLVTGSPNTKT